MKNPAYATETNMVTNAINFIRFSTVYKHFLNKLKRLLFIEIFIATVLPEILIIIIIKSLADIWF